MPVDNGIHIQIRASIYASLNGRHKLLTVTSRAVSTILGGVHGETHYIGTPIISKSAEGILVHILRIPGQAVSAHAMELEGLTMGIHKLCSLDGKLAMLAKESGGACRCTTCRAYRCTTCRICRSASCIAW